MVEDLKLKIYDIIEERAKQIGKKEAYKEILGSLTTVRKEFVLRHGYDKKVLKYFDILIEDYKAKMLL